jgi:uncharacterized damage-inducible protein DinB
MVERESRLEAVRRSFDGDAWHGPALADVLAGVSVEAAWHRPGANVHTIAELVLHIAAWSSEVARRLEGAQPAEPLEGDWPHPGDPEEWVWHEILNRLQQARAHVLSAIERTPLDRLSAVVGATRDAPLGTGVTYAAMIDGLAQHNAYHGGQIMLIRKLLPG